MNTLQLPKDYQKIITIDPKKDKKLFISLNVWSLVLGFSVLAISAMTSKSNIITFGIPQLLAIMFGGVLYVILHEFTHGLAIKITSGFSVQYGFAGFAAYAGNKDAFFNKKSYIIIALAPVVIFGLIFLVASIIFSLSWFWVFIILQVINVSGAVGDIYVTYIALKMPKDLLVNDLGLSMTFYSAAKKD